MARRIVRRSDGDRRPSLTAASQPVDEKSNPFKSNMGGQRNDWQAEAWSLYDQVGELRYYVSWLSSICSGVRLIASDLDPITGLPTGVTDNKRAIEIVNAIAGGTMGQAALIKRVVECLSVPGELWVAILELPGGGEQWHVLSRDEVKRKSQGKVEIELPDGTTHNVVFGRDVMFRVWRHHPRKARECDSPVRASIPSLHEIVRTTKTIANAARSRLIGNGIVFVPQEMSLPSMAAPVTSDKPGDPVPPLIGQPAVEELSELIYRVATVAADDETSMAALLPVFASVPAEQIDAVSHIKFDTDVTDTAIKIRNDAIARLAMGLDVSPERLLGIGVSANHWSAWQIGDEDVRLHVRPVMDIIVAAIQKDLLTKMFVDEGIDPTKTVIWYDASQLTADPDLSEHARDAFDRGAINSKAYREFLGLGDTGYDMGTLEGWQTWATDAVMKDPTQLQNLLPLLALLEGVVEPTPTPAIQGAGDPNENEDPEDRPDQEGTPKTKENGSGGQAEITSPHQLAFLQTYVTRALELAGKRRRRPKDYNRLGDLRAHDFHRVMGPADPDEIPKLTSGWDDTLTNEVLDMIGLDGTYLRAEVERIVRKELTREVIDA